MERVSSLREAQRQVTRDRIVDGALIAFAEKGFSAATIEDIVQAAAITRTTFYQHFKGKTDLLPELQDRARAELRPLWSSLQAMPPSPHRALVEAWLVNAIGEWERHRTLIAVTYDALAAVGDLSTARGSVQAEELSLFVEAIRHFGWADDVSARVEGMLLLAQLERAFFYWSAEVERDEPVRNALVEVLTETWYCAFARAAETAKPAKRRRSRAVSS